MAEALVPPRLTAWKHKQTMYQERFPLCWALHYQQIDRFWHEWMPDLMRTERRTYDARVTHFDNTCHWLVDFTATSEYDPEAPWDHIVNQSVTSHQSDKWWNEHFVWPAQQITTKIRTESSFIDNDAPVGLASESVDTAGGTGSAHIQAPQAPTEKAVMQEGSGNTPVHTHAPQGLKRKLSDDNSGAMTICQMYNKGRCDLVTSNGAAGPYSCQKRPHTIHACDICGRPNHMARDCDRTRASAGHGPAHGQGKRGGRR